MINTNTVNEMFTKYSKGTVFRIAQMNNFKFRIEFSNAASANDLKIENCSRETMDILQTAQTWNGPETTSEYSYAYEPPSIL